MKGAFKSMEWRFVKVIDDEKLIENFESKAIYTFSDSFKKCVKSNNGGRPSVSAFDTNKAKEREIKSLLSFNREDTDNIWKMNEWVKAELNDKYVAFAIDNFGNLICFDCGNDNVVFWNHESNGIEFIAKDFDAFLACLYD